MFPLELKALLCYVIPLLATLDRLFLPVGDVNFSTWYTLVTSLGAYNNKAHCCQVCMEKSTKADRNLGQTVHCLSSIEDSQTHQGPPRKVPERRFDHIHVNLVGPLPLLPSSGFTHLVTVIDRFSWWPEAIPLNNTTSASCAHALIFTGLLVLAYRSTFCRTGGHSSPHTTAYHPLRFEHVSWVQTWYRNYPGYY